MTKTDKVNSDKYVDDSELFDSDNNSDGSIFQVKSDQVRKESYDCRKPRWWTQLSGRRGTRSQRQTIQRMTNQCYCISKETLSEFSRLSNSSSIKQRIVGILDKNLDNSNNTTVEDFCSDDDLWKKAWWTRTLSIYDPSVASTIFTPENESDFCNGSQKYADKISKMKTNENPLPSQAFEEIWLEIGFGNGDNLLANSLRLHKILHIGSEIHQPGIGTVLKKMEVGIESCLETIADEAPTKRKTCSAVLAPSEEIEGENSNSLLENSKPNLPYQNIRILPGDGIKLLSHLPCNFLDTILITFPDPWPKDSQARWRVVQKQTIEEMRRVLKLKGRVYIATDVECFHVWAHQLFQNESVKDLSVHDDNVEKSATITHHILSEQDPSCHWKEIYPCPSRDKWLPVISYYEQKGINEGRQTLVQCWQAC